MKENSLWKYCTPQHCKEFILSFRLFGNTKWTERKQLACLYAVSNHVEQHYRAITIKKKNGTSRKLLCPSPLLKRIQRNILHNILDQIPISSYATAYHKGTGIISNAAVHVGKKQLLKLDLKDFFHSIMFIMVYQNAFSGIYFPPSVRSLLTNLCCYKDYLPQGAPTSASISNLVLKPFDDYIGLWCKEHKISYTRYCDDMTFSGVFDAQMVKNKVRSYLETMGFTLNYNKTKLLSECERQIVTGITVNQKLQASKTYRKSLRQEIYYCMKYGVRSHLMQVGYEYYLQMGEDGTKKYLQRLLSKINFVLQVNPQDLFFQNAKVNVKALMFSEVQTT